MRQVDLREPGRIDTRTYLAMAAEYHVLNGNGDFAVGLHAARQG
jgi:hypothetical protein